MVKLKDTFNARVVKTNEIERCHHMAWYIKWWGRGKKCKDGEEGGGVGVGSWGWTSKESCMLRKRTCFGGGTICLEGRPSLQRDNKTCGVSLCLLATLHYLYGLYIKSAIFYRAACATKGAYIHDTCLSWDLYMQRFVAFLWGCHVPCASLTVRVRARARFPC